jgi:putative ABC transport system permease protein
VPESGKSYFIPPVGIGTLALMSWIETIRLAIEAIRAHKLRSFLTLLGIIIGVFSVTAVATVIEGFSGYVNEKIAAYGSGAFQVEKASFQGFGNFEKFLKAIQKNPDLTIEDMYALREKVTLAEQVGAQDGSARTIRFGGNELGNVGIQGVTSNFPSFSTLEPDTGTFFSDFDEENRRTVVFLGADVAKSLFPDGGAVGKQIKLGNDPFTVIGVAKPLGSFLGQSQDNFAQIPLSTFQKLFGKQQRSLTLYVKPRKSAASESVEDQVRLALRARHRLDFNAEDDFSITTDQATQGFFGTLTATIGAVVLPITGISLVVGGIVVMNIMLVSVTERTREIGIRKALGARRRDILRQFLAESVLLSLTGGFIGLISAYSIMKLVSWLWGLPVALPIWAVLAAMGVSSSVGLFFGIYPANKAAKLDPIQALRAD